MTTRLRLRRFSWILAPTVTLGAALALTASAAALPLALNVDSNADPGDGNCATNGCTLREAINQLNDGDTVEQDAIFIDLTNAPSQTISLGSALPAIAEPLAISGAPGTRPTIDANDSFRPMLIFAIASDVDLTNLTISRGNSNFQGGAISTGAALTLIDVAVTDSRTTTPNDDGGGIYATGPLTLIDSTVQNNRTLAELSHGGGIAAYNGLTIRRSTIFGNSTHGQFSAGAGAAVAGSGTSVIENSTISGNEGVGAMNRAGGFFASVLPATIRDSTIVGNSAAFAGGVYSSSSDVTITNSIVNDNVVTTVAPDIQVEFGSMAIDYSLIGSTSGTTFTEPTPGSNLIGVDPQLGPLVDNGGLVLTHRPAVGSPVVDQGMSADPLDARGLPRPVDLPDVTNPALPGANGADMGAVERGAADVERDLPSNEFSIGKLTRNKKKGTAKLAVTVPGAGKVDLAGRSVKPASVQAAAAATLSVPVKATGKKKRKLKRSGKVKLALEVTFSPDGGTANSKSTKVKLKRKRR